MIRTPPQHNTINPPGQIINRGIGIDVYLIMETTKCSRSDAQRVLDLMHKDNLSLGEAARTIGVIK